MLGTSNPLVGLVTGVFNAVAHAWWAVLLVLGLKLGPRWGRGWLIRRGGLK